MGRPQGRHPGPSLPEPPTSHWVMPPPVTRRFCGIETVISLYQRGGIVQSSQETLLLLQQVQRDEAAEICFI